MLKIIKEFNNQSGRFNRYKFWIYTLIMQFITFIFFSTLMWFGAEYAIILLVKIGSFGMMLTMLYISFTAYIKRLHDLDKSGWMSLLMFIPLANIYLFIICGFIKGTQGKNRFGNNPLGNSEENIIENNDSNIQL